jgi:hypothetical protein
VTNKILHWIEACQKRLQVCIGPTGWIKPRVNDNIVVSARRNNRKIPG